MLLALTIRNFKSIREAKVRFGGLTCVIGHNGAGKSNLFDAIHFLSLLADRDISQASREIRRSHDGSASPLDLVFGRDPGLTVELVADMIVPHEVTDDFGIATETATTMLTYGLALRYDKRSDRLLVASEQLTHSRRSEFASFTRFRSSPEFRSSVAFGSRRGGPLISTKDEKIMLHGDAGSRGRPAPVGRSPLTVVGGTNTSDYPTVLGAKREMQSWRLLHLEPSAMRAPDARSARPHVSASGGNLAATLSTLVSDQAAVRLEIVNRLRELNSDVIDLEPYADEARDQLVLRAKVPGVGNWLYGRSLSDGTLRYIALALMLADVQDSGVLCLEEPENGIHPSRIPNLVRLLYDYAVDVDEAVGPDNPLRQVIINTHSPEIARQVFSEDLVFAEKASVAGGASFSVFRPIEEAWRADKDPLVALPKDRQAIADFIGGSPLKPELEQLQLEFGFGSAR